MKLYAILDSAGPTTYHRSRAYGTEFDGIRTRVHWSPVLVCGLACFRGLTE
jgi:hypothetical protein